MGLGRKNLSSPHRDPLERHSMTYAVGSTQWKVYGKLPSSAYCVLRTVYHPLPTAHRPLPTARNQRPQNLFKGIGHAEHAEIGGMGTVGGGFAVVAEKVFAFQVVEVLGA